MTKREKQILSRLKKLDRPDALPGMAHFGIDTENAYGVALPELGRLAKEIGQDHPLALALWASGVHDARLLASIIAAPADTDRALAEVWALDFRSWNLCDQCCINLFRKTAFARDLVDAWRSREEEFVKRAAFAMIAVLAVHDKAAEDDVFTALLPIIEDAASDPRNFVKKTVNWSLRQIDKRNRELQSGPVQTRIVKKG
jgi:3-methyladenine DNA glycosylase AlkD